MDPEVRAKILADYPDAEEQTWRRIYAGRTIFYDTKTHQPRPHFTENQILAYLIYGNALAADWGCNLRLSSEEKKLWQRHFENTSRILFTPGQGR